MTFIFRSLLLLIAVFSSLSAAAQQQQRNIAKQLTVWTAPTVQCGGASGTTFELQSSNGSPAYQPEANLCIKITSATGNLIAGSPPSGFPYTTPQFTSPPLNLTSGASYTVEVVYCDTGSHAFPYSGPTGPSPVPATFPYLNTTLVAPNCRKGMTWGKYGAGDPISGVTRVGCQPNGNGGVSCNPYTGDTACNIQQPVLCKKELSLPKPASFSGPNWVGNVIATTPAIAPAAAGLNTRAAVNAYCVAQFGAGWKVGAFHDGGGWTFAAYGDVGTQSPRFWVDIADQPNGNCWMP